MTTDQDGQVQMVRQRLQAAGERWTTPRAAVVGALIATPGHPTVEELLALARTRDAHVSLATVYRTLAVLHDLGLVRRIIADGATHYEYELGSRHHHLVDVDEGTVAEVRSAAFDAAQASLLATHDCVLAGSGLDIPVRRQARRSRKSA
jgi:Fur family ferric uptake transcriptional regulator